jgi:hypothetical protein
MGGGKEICIESDVQGVSNIHNAGLAGVLQRPIAKRPVTLPMAIIILLHP